MKKFFIRSFLYISFLIILLAPEKGISEYVLIDGTEASVNGSVILKTDLNKYLCYLSIKEGVSLESFDRKALLQDLIDESLIVGEASKTGLYKLPPELLSERADKIRNIIGDCEEKCKNLCQDSSFPSERAYMEVLTNEFVKKRIEVFIRVNEKEIIDYFRERYGADKTKYNEAIRNEIMEELKQRRVEIELSNFLQRIRNRATIVVPED